VPLALTTTSNGAFAFAKHRALHLVVGGEEFVAGHRELGGQLVKRQQNLAGVLHKPVKRMKAGSPAVVRVGEEGSVQACGKEAEVQVCGQRQIASS